MELTYARCAGLDVHKDTVVACLRVAVDGRIRRETKTFGTMTIDLLGLQQWLVDEEVTHVAMEATGVYWKPVWHILEPVCTLILANPAHIKNVPGRKTDVKDAEWIAELPARMPAYRSWFARRAKLWLMEVRAGAAAKIKAGCAFSGAP